MTTPLAIHSLVKDYSSLRAVDHVTFEVRKGEIFGLLGPNGAGKTSIISCIVTLERPTDGAITVFGHDVTRSGRKAKRLTGFVPQEIIHHGFFTVEEILTFHSGYYGVLHNETQIHDLLHELGLWQVKDRRVKQLSGGMRRRLLIAKALVHKPRLLLLDEPTAGVDLELRNTLWKYVRRLRDEGMSILLTTHYLNEAEELCDRVGIIDEGKLLRVGAKERLIADYTSRKIIMTLRKPDTSIKNEYLTGWDDGRFYFNLPNNIPVGDLIQQLNIDLHQIKDLQIREGSLEDAFLKVIGQS